MSSCPVLDEPIIHEILINLARDDIISFQTDLSLALVEFSVGIENEHQLSTTTSNRPDGSKILFRPFASSAAVGTKIIVTPAPDSDGRTGSLHGVLVLLDKNGIPSGLLSAEEVTGYRTSLCAMIPFTWRKHVDNILVFGAGLQALWHIRLILALRGSEARTITLVNRSVSRARDLIDRVKQENQLRWKSDCTFHCLDPSAPDHARLLETRLSHIDAVFCTVASKSPLFPAAYITERTSDRKPLLSAVGAWQADMIELDPAILQHAVNTDDGCNPVGGPGGVVLVDDGKCALVHSGELTQSGLAQDQLIEVGRIVAMKLGRLPSAYSLDFEKTTRWIEEGLVVYKSVGVSLTDLAAGNAILTLAKEKKKVSED